jgi:NAD(P)-dependent dehydrogenase (short-subunit alcohol dehydrogenase family)
MSERNLAGKVAIVTGGGGGIGSATAARLARAGAAVAVVDIRRSAADHVAAGLSGEGLAAQAFVVDVSQEDQVRAFVADTVRAFGRIDILHNNAVNSAAAVWERDLQLVDMDVEVWDQIFAVNTRGPMLLAKHVIPQMLAQGTGGVIVNMSSGASERGQPDRLTAYGASKGALNSLTKYIAVQYGPQNIRCNALVCGVVATDALRSFFSAEEIEGLAGDTMLRRPSTPEDIAAMVHFLALDDARQITGQLIRIDGGMT